MSGTEYFGKDKNINPPSYQESTFNRVLIITSTVLGLVSVLVLIALNITTLTVGISNRMDGGRVTEKIQNIETGVSSVKDSVSSSVNPKLSIINTATSYSLPSLITSQIKGIRNDIYQYCSPRYDSPTGECPVSEHPSHEGNFKLYDPETVLKCNSSSNIYQSLQGFEYLPFASFIPSPTITKGCTRIPTFSLSENLYSYSHNIIHVSCSDASISSQYWSIGKIVQGQNNTPVFKEIVNWYLNDGKNRKSCSTVATLNGAWLGCNIVNMTEKEDYLTPGIMEVFIGYMDVFGRKYSWYFPSNRFPTDYTYDSLYFSVGSGIAKDGKIYMLMYGGLGVTVPGNAYCEAPECSNPDQNICNKAQKPLFFGGKQILNGILSFDDVVDKVPNLRFQTIDPKYITMGAEGRLLYYPQIDKSYIYLRSSSWHALLQFGEITLGDNITIDWKQFTTFTRPSIDPCSSANRCPKVCVVGVYTDFFLLAEDDTLGISVMLNGGKVRRAPQIKIGDINQFYFTKEVVSANQEAWYTTTTCFIYFNVPWCISIIEMKPGTIGYMEPVSIMYPLWNTCLGEMVEYQEHDDDDENE